jgi:hypothetical protein
MTVMGSAMAQTPVGRATIGMTATGSALAQTCVDWARTGMTGMKAKAPMAAS